MRAGNAAALRWAVRSTGALVLAFAAVLAWAEDAAVGSAGAVGALGAVGAAGVVGAKVRFKTRPNAPQPVPYRACFSAAAARHGVNEQLLWAIAKVESGFDSKAQHKNTNATTDYGVMQINSSHLPWLQRFGIELHHLTQQPCTNIDVGAVILAGMISRFGSTWRAVGAYGAGVGVAADPVRSGYAAKVRRAFVGLEPAGTRLPLITGRAAVMPTPTPTSTPTPISAAQLALANARSRADAESALRPQQAMFAMQVLE